MRFEFATAGRIVFGQGMLREIGSLARQFGKRALIVTARDSGRAQALVANLGQSEVEHIFFSVRGEPSVETVEKGAALYKDEKCDLVIGFGGGSALDTGKAIAAVTTNPGEL